MSLFVNNNNKNGLDGKKQNCNANNSFELSIGEVSKLLGLPTHTIRFWTEEFEQNIVHHIGSGGRRYYNNQSIEIFKILHKFIHRDGIKIKAIKDRGLLPIVNKNIAGNIFVKANIIKPSFAPSYNASETYPVKATEKPAEKATAKIYANTFQNIQKKQSGDNFVMIKKPSKNSSLKKSISDLKQCFQNLLTKLDPT